MLRACYSALRRVAAHCSAFCSQLQRVMGVLQRVTGRYSVLRARYSVSQARYGRVTGRCSALQRVTARYGRVTGVLQRVTGVLQRVAVRHVTLCYSALQACYGRITACHGRVTGALQRATAGAVTAGGDAQLLSISSGAGSQHALSLDVPDWATGAAAGALAGGSAACEAPCAAVAEPAFCSCSRSHQFSLLTTLRLSACPPRHHPGALPYSRTLTCGWPRTPSQSRQRAVATFAGVGRPPAVTGRASVADRSIRTTGNKANTLPGTQDTTARPASPAGC